jgi:hypothetical protein
MGRNFFGKQLVHRDAPSFLYISPKRDVRKRPLRSEVSQRSWSGRHSPSTSERWPCYRPCQKSLPWCARNPSPGIGTGPPPTSPTAEGVWWGTTWVRCDQCGAVAGEASDVMDARGLNRLGQGHRRQNSGQPPGQHRLARPRGAQQQDVVGRTPASRLASPVPLGLLMAPLPNPREAASPVLGPLMTIRQATPSPPGGRRCQSPR